MTARQQLDRLRSTCDTIARHPKMTPDQRRRGLTYVRMAVGALMREWRAGRLA